MIKVKSWSKLLWAVFLCEGAGVVGSVFTFSAIPTWYAGLVKPFFSPPNFVFGPVWTALYALMGVSLYLIWISKVKAKRQAMRVFWVQLGLNAFWSVLFFGLRLPGVAFVEIVGLWVAIFLTIRSFAKVSKVAGYLLYPYLAWVIFALILNLSIWVLNW